MERKLIASFVGLKHYMYFMLKLMQKFCQYFNLYYDLL